MWFVGRWYLVIGVGSVYFSGVVGEEIDLFFVLK